uniref:TEP-1 C-terminal beta-propeller domain-containing protein n=1 Tax=Palpitomonas bilix TaxID=652834 RepID=A0A7S3FXH2_9EUKA|mmetsp:Transcript_10885/g.28555  ORF Transcript_10885/g.28555 Transcript_10885/m.28555 type:complete len:721 (+) Transcript_10885:265-2427(+)
MSRKSDKVRIVYTIKDGSEKHKFGVNKLVWGGQDNSTLFSLGRDSSIRAWTANGDAQRPKLDYTLSGHCHWVTDGVSVGENTLVSSSFDQRLLMWDLPSQKLTQLGNHDDYIKCISYACTAGVVVSGGFDRMLKVWDLRRGASTASTSASGRAETPPSRPKLESKSGSVYSISSSADASVVVFGSTDGVLKVWDTREKKSDSTRDLRGHRDTVRCVQVSKEGTQVVSASSDRTVRTWDMRTLRELSCFSHHNASVFSLAVNDSFSHFLSGDSDGKVYMTSMSGGGLIEQGDEWESVCLFDAGQPVLSLCPARLDYAFGGGVWSATTDSSLHYWDFHQRLRSPGDSGIRRAMQSYIGVGEAREAAEGGFAKEDAGVYPLLSSPSTAIEGDKAITKFHILNDKVHVLTMNSAGQLHVFNLLTGDSHPHIGSGEEDFNREVKALSKEVSVPLWCSIDIWSGSLMVSLDASKCLSADTYTEDCNIRMEGEPDEKFNIGQEVLRALFANYLVQSRENKKKLKEKEEEEGGEKEDSSRAEAHLGDAAEDDRPIVRFSHPDRIQVTLLDSSTGLATLSKPLPQLAPRDVPPTWAMGPIEMTGALQQTAATKLNFAVLSAPGMPVATESSTQKLTAQGSVRLAKILAFVKGRVEVCCDDKEVEREFAEGPVDKLLKMTCKGVEVSPNTTLSTVRQFMWKESGDTQFVYDLTDSAKQAGIRLIVAPKHK